LLLLLTLGDIVFVWLLTNKLLENEPGNKLKGVTCSSSHTLFISEIFKLSFEWVFMW
jgi:hypothetical protein